MNLGYAFALKAERKRLTSQSTYNHDKCLNAICSDVESVSANFMPTKGINYVGILHDSRTGYSRNADQMTITDTASSANRVSHARMVFNHHKGEVLKFNS